MVLDVFGSHGTPNELIKIDIWHSKKQITVAVIVSKYILCVAQWHIIL